MIRLFSMCLSIGCIVAGSALADPFPLIENPKHWGAFTDKDGAAKYCFMAGKPANSTPKNVKRGPIWVMVTHRPGDKVKNEMHVITGYTYRKGSDVTVEIDKQRFTLFTEADTAWAKTAKDDARLVAAMRRGNRMVIKGMSSRGTKTVDTYSLTGFTAAHKLINKACKVK